MPLQIDSLPARATKGMLLRWLLDTGEVKKPQVGTIEIFGRQAGVEIPDNVGPRLARRLDGEKLNGRVTQVWFETAEPESDETTSRHFTRLLRWLEMERGAEARQADEWRQAAGEQDSSTGFVNLVLRAEDTGLGGHTLLTLGRRSPMQALPATQLRVGSPVRLAEQGADSGTRRGVVTRLTAHEVEVAVGKPVEPAGDQPVFRVDAADDETAARRCRSALAQARHTTDARITRLRDVCLGLREPAFTESAPPAFEDANLNESQRAAVTFALAAEDAAVIHGPPGTGKTRTLVELIRQSVGKGRKVLVCAPSNLAVDNLFERLLQRGTNAVRLGHLARVSPHLQEHCLTALVPKHRDMRLLKKMRAEAADLFRKAGSSRNLDRGARQSLREEARDLLADARDVEANIAESILDEAEVVCATNTGISSDLLGTRRFDLVVIDEACQCVEPACWIPLLRADRLVLAGDHCQLPPTVISTEAAREGFAVSLQERLVELHGERVCRPLLVQYRMHEDIMRFSSDQFYEGRLAADESVAAHRLCELPDVTADELTECAVRFIDTSGSGYEEKREPAGRSLANPEEADLAVKKARDLVALGVPPDAIAIITPYSAQVDQLRERTPDDGFDIGTVDGFQGREKEAVIISLVRSNTANEIGFLRDTRRMNVALTRARRKLIVIGDSATIAGDSFYGSLLSHFDTIGAYHGIWDE